MARCNSGFGVQRTAGDAVFQGQPLEELHDNESLAVFLVNLVDGADVGMVQSGGGAGFPLKAIQGLAVLGKFYGQKLKRDEAAQLGVLSPVHHAHTAAAKFLEDAVVRNSLADHWRKSYVRETGKSMNAV